MIDEFDIENIRILRENIAVMDGIILDRRDEMEQARIYAHKIRIRLSFNLASYLKGLEKSYETNRS